MGQAKPNKKRRIKGKIVSESKYQKKDPEIEFNPDDDDYADNDIPEDLSMPKNNEHGDALDLTRKTSSLESESISNRVQINSSKLFNITPSHKTLPQLAPNFNNQGLRIYPKMI